MTKARRQIAPKAAPKAAPKEINWKKPLIGTQMPYAVKVISRKGNDPDFPIIIEIMRPESTQVRKVNKEGRAYPGNQPPLVRNAPEAT